jgi:hypothetical protein
MRFYKLYESLINELNDNEIKKAQRYANKRHYNIDFGPMFKKERTVVKHLKLDNELIKRQYNLLLSNNKVGISNMKDVIFKELKSTVKKNKKVKHVDPEKNTVTLDDNREMKLTKFLNKNTLNTDYVIVISHKPEDVVGLSTDKGWVSCMNLRTGSYRSEPYKHVKNGNMVAYLIQGKPSQVNKIMDDHYENGLFQQKAISRISIKRFEGMNTKKYMVPKDEFIYISENMCYRAVGKAEFVEDKIKFKETVNEVLEKNNQQTTSISDFNYKRKKGYSDALQTSISFINKKEFLKLSEKNQIKILRKKPEAINYIKNPTDNMLIALLKKNPNYFFYVKKYPMSDKVKKYAIKYSPGSYLEYLKEKKQPTSEDEIFDIINSDPHNIVSLSHSKILQNLPEKTKEKIKQIAKTVKDENFQSLIKLNSFWNNPKPLTGKDRKEMDKFLDMFEL